MTKNRKKGRKAKERNKSGRVKEDIKQNEGP